ncbi:hypothetical protein [Streptomyces tsukubensis]|uniref:Secreted protein n=1 Tax=Streptomyces tsukubensis TaxID=83656 RepID=A0A1V4A741_9ACTN|nr:hypothetical protein [Streptomyces tsukubensis]OON77048.1 hypothetical protein B1H18_19895 [Streptomyces tsukubensis]QFR93757.1 hypothetical protein GBW32_12600 [Streptomyces tsukubensis]
MRRALIHTLAWTLATGASVTLSWWGVHTVMAGTAYDPPRALPITGVTGGLPSGRSAKPRVSSTHRPRPTPTTSATGAPSPTPTPSHAAPAGKPARPTPEPPSSPSSSHSPSGKVKSYPVSGGRAVFSMGASSAQLVSATPEPGWQMRVWKQEEWIRVQFSKGEQQASIFCTWNGHPPMVERDDP